MLVFLDFEASSLSKRSYPIEVAWVFGDGTAESYLIRPAPEWLEWDPAAEAIHRIPRAMLEADGSPHDQVARHMVDVLAGHDLLASAPSWDGKWLSSLLRAAGLPRHSLRLRDSDTARAEAATAILKGAITESELEETVRGLLVLSEVRAPGQAPAHRALADAQEERQGWLAAQAAAVRHLASVSRT